MKIIPFILLIGIVISCSDTVAPKQVPEPEKTKSPTIAGRWKTVNAEMVPFGHISYCENLGLNSVFEFTDDGQLKVYADEKTLTPCNGKQSYNMSGKTLQITEDDMIFNYQVPKLTADSLFLITKYIPMEMLRKMEISEKQMQKIKKDGFQVTLVRTE